MFGFDELFDFNRDGSLDSIERALQFEFMDRMINDDDDDDEYDEDDDDEDVFGSAGLDYDELEMMDPVERRAILAEAGLDPYAYAF